MDAVLVDLAQAHELVVGIHDELAVVHPHNQLFLGAGEGDGCDEGGGLQFVDLLQQEVVLHFQGVGLVGLVILLLPDFVDFEDGIEAGQSEEVGVQMHEAHANEILLILVLE